MKKIVYLLILFSAVIFLIPACSDSNKQVSKNVNIQGKEFQDKLIDANKMYVKRESDEIDQYVAHKGWTMVKTGTGLRYMIIRKGTGNQAKPEQLAKVNYKISLLDGTVCYSSDSIGPREFVVAGDNVESGLHEGIQYMHVGDKAVMILPSHLAHGLIGDENKIPPKASVVYELELLSLKERVRN